MLLPRGVMDRLPSLADRLKVRDPTAVPWSASTDRVGGWRGWVGGAPRRPGATRRCEGAACPLVAAARQRRAEGRICWAAHGLQGSSRCCVQSGALPLTWPPHPTAPTVCQLDGGWQGDLRQVPGRLRQLLGEWWGCRRRAAARHSVPHHGCSSTEHVSAAASAQAQSAVAAVESLILIGEGRAYNAANASHNLSEQQLVVRAGFGGRSGRRLRCLPGEVWVASLRRAPCCLLQGAAGSCRARRSCLLPLRRTACARRPGPAPAPRGPATAARAAGATRPFGTCRTTRVGWFTRRSVCLVLCCSRGGRRGERRRGGARSRALRARRWAPPGSCPARARTHPPAHPHLPTNLPTPVHAWTKRSGA